MNRLAIRGSVFVGTLGSIVVYDHRNPGFRRSFQFWTTLAPTIIEYQYIKVKARLEGDEGIADLDRRIEEFHKRTALKTLDIITSLGGIYVKLAQFAAAMGSGLILDDYIQALQPLMDGVPPRPLETIIEIIENDLNNNENKLLQNGEEKKKKKDDNDDDDETKDIKRKKKTINDVFQTFDEESLGAASIAQAHRATLLDGREVVVKVQYPEVAANYIADFDNLEILAGFFLKESVETIKNLRIRHEYELDFRLEAANLKICAENAQKHGFSPSIVSIPKLIDECPATKNVLVMEYLAGDSMQVVIDHEMSEIATALGIKGGVKELRKQTMKALKQHFRKGGGSTHNNNNSPNQDGRNKSNQEGNNIMKTILGNDHSSSHINDTMMSDMLNNDVQDNDQDNSLISLIMEKGSYLFSGDNGFIGVEAGMRVLKTYIGLRRWLLDTSESIDEYYLYFKKIIFNLLSGFGLLSITTTDQKKEEKDNDTKMNKKMNENNLKSSSSSKEHGRIIGLGNGDQYSIKITQKNNSKDKNQKIKKVNLDEKLHQLVKVHGYQLLIDGVFNADPHPGNILLLKDGSLGLIDYGIVGTLTLEERLLVARVIVALAEDNLDEAARIYLESGYRIVDLMGNDQPPSLVGRVARFHLDKMDLSLIQLYPEEVEEKKNENNTSLIVSKDNKNSKPQSILRVLHSSMELSAPDWCLQSRRLGCLLIGVCTQAGRPISLAKEWEPIARQVIAEHEKSLKK